MRLDKMVGHVVGRSPAGVGSAKTPRNEFMQLVRRYPMRLIRFGRPGWRRDRAFEIMNMNVLACLDGSVRPANWKTVFYDSLAGSNVAKRNFVSGRNVAGDGNANLIALAAAHVPNRHGGGGLNWLKQCCHIVGGAKPRGDDRPGRI
jgi:hypothetical protein